MTEEQNRRGRIGAEVNPFYQDNHIKIYNKDCRSMAELPDESIQCVVTSPPYWGLRKYAGDQDLIWGGNDCEHEWGDEIPRAGFRSNDSHPGKLQSIATQNRNIGGSNFCSLCGAWRGAYGLEPTPEMYVEHTIEILREIRRVLRKDGVVFWNIGDSYMGGKGQSGRKDHNLEQRRAEGRTFQKREYCYQDQDAPQDLCKHKYIKAKDMCLIPFRVAIAAQTDGWYVRSDIIWSKPNPMPESVTDRPTESHEYILMLTKSARYYWDADAVRVPLTFPDRTYNSDVSQHKTKSLKDNGNRTTGGLHDGRTQYANPLGRNIRSVWEFPTQPYPEAHFAVFPEKLPETCIKAATPEVGCCSKCGAPYERITERIGGPPTGKHSSHHEQTSSKPEEYKLGPYGADLSRIYKEYGYAYNETLGWQPTCKCNASRVPSLVLDPLMGAGTTLSVAKNLNRYAVGYELSEEYCQLAVERCRQQVLL